MDGIPPDLASGGGGLRGLLVGGLDAGSVTSDHSPPWDTPVVRSGQDFDRKDTSMTVTVNSVGGVQTFDQPDVAFSVNDDGTLDVLDTSGDQIAVFRSWDSVSTDAFDAAATPPVPAPADATTVNPAPPEPTPHAPEEPAGTPTPQETSVTADASTAPVTPETPLEQQVVIPASPGGTTIGSPAS